MKNPAVAYTHPADDAYLHIVWGEFTLAFDTGAEVKGDNLEYLRELGGMILAAVEDYEGQSDAK